MIYRKRQNARAQERRLVARIAVLTGQIDRELRRTWLRRTAARPNGPSAMVHRVIIRQRKRAKVTP